MKEAFLFINNEYGITQIPFSEVKGTHYRYWAGTYKDEIWVDIILSGVSGRFVIGKFDENDTTGAQNLVNEVWTHKQENEDMYIGEWELGLPKPQIREEEK